MPEVQVHEPVLTLSDAAGLEADFTAVYGAFAEVRGARDQGSHLKKGLSVDPDSDPRQLFEGSVQSTKRLMCRCCSILIHAHF